MEMQVYETIKTQIKQLMQINLDHYKDEQMRRRLDSWLVRSGSATWNDYLVRVRSDAKEMTRFRDYLTINVTSLFRDPERWNALRDQVMPELLRVAAQLRPTNAGLRIWSAGCSIGAEPYTLVMMLDEIAPNRNHTILATDLDKGAVARAKTGGGFNEDEIANLTAAQRTKYLEPGGPPYRVKQSVIKKIDFREHNLLADPFPKDMDLVICRNVVIYFTTETKDLLYRRFSSALRTNGYLFVGATEILPRPLELGFVGAGISFYKAN